MSTQLKLRRGTTAQHSTFTGAEGEVTVDTTKDTLVVHDGTTAGGVPLIKDATGSVVTNNLADASVTALKLASNAVTTAKILDANVTASKLAAGAARTNFGAGTVLQVVQVVKTDSFSSSTNGYVDVTGLSVSITPTSSSSKILVVATLSGGNPLNSNFTINLMRNSGNICQSTSATANSTAALPYGVNYNFISVPITFLDSPATASATTYKIQIHTYGSTGYVNIRSTDQYYGGTSQITLMEIAA